MSDSMENYSKKMQKTIEVLGREFTTIRAGRANASVLDRITVDFYGSPSPIVQIATVAVPEPRMLTIQPWDASLLKAIEKAILASDLGINPQNDGKIIRLTFPQLTEERRHELTRQVHKYAEEAKIAMRNIRREANEKFKDMKKKSEITEDDQKDMEKEIQELTDKACKDIDILVSAKEKELLEV